MLNTNNSDGVGLINMKKKYVFGSFDYNRLLGFMETFLFYLYYNEQITIPAIKVAMFCFEKCYV